MKYIELREEEKAELRETLWEQSVFQHDDDFGYNEYAYLSAEFAEAVDNAKSPEDIPENVMKETFGSYDFVAEDFFCNI